MRKVKGDDIIIPLTCELFNLPPPPFEGYTMIFFENVIARRVQQVSLPVKIVLECWLFLNWDLFYRTKGIMIKKVVLPGIL